MIQISNKVKLLIFLVCIIVLISTVNTTYSRYVSAASGTVTTNFARWQIFINNENITSNYGTSMTFTPIILPNENVAANKIAPSSNGYFDIAINPTNVDVSFTYDINVNIPEDSLITDIKVTDYSIYDGTEIPENTDLEKVSLTTSNLTNTLLYDNSEENFSFKPFIIRMYFSWIDDDTEIMDDSSDSNIGNMIANGEDTKFELGISINFKQYTGEDDSSNNVKSEEEIISEGNDDGIDNLNESDNPDIVEELENPDTPVETDDTENNESSNSLEEPTGSEE